MNYHIARHVDDRRYYLVRGEILGALSLKYYWTPHKSKAKLFADEGKDVIGQLERFSRKWYPVTLIPELGIE